MAILIVRELDGLVLVIAVVLTAVATSDLITAATVLPFPEAHLVGITQSVPFSDWLLSLSNMHLSFLHVFSWFDDSFLFSAE